jgi:hypothetical protein
MGENRGFYKGKRRDDPEDWPANKGLFPVVLDGIFIGFTQADAV